MHAHILPLRKFHARVRPEWSTTRKEWFHQRISWYFAGIPVVHSGTATIRRSSLQVGKPNTPVRRTMSIAGGIPVVPPTIPGAAACHKSPRAPPAHRRTHSMGSTGSIGSSGSQGDPEPAPSSSPLNLSGEDLPLPPPPPPEELDFPHEHVAGGNNGDVGHGSNSMLDSSPRQRGSIASKHASLMHSLNEKFGATLPQTVPSPPVKHVQAPPYVQQTVVMRNEQQQGAAMYAPQQLGAQPQHYSHYGTSEVTENATTPTATNQAFGLLSSDDITPTGDPPPDSLMNQIARGVKLRKTISNDRSAPRFWYGLAA